MPVKYSLKHSFLILLGGLAFASGIAFLANLALAGPKLGPHYDFLLSRQPQPPVSGEILIIDTDEFTDSSDIFTVLMILTEMEAANLIFAGRVSPSSSPVTITEAEIRRRFVDEYLLIGTNIRNLFEAIRSGSVSPVQAPNYVERLLELTEQGRDRLLTALIDRDEELLRSITIFGNYLEADTDHVTDSGGKIRRVKPASFETSIEHPVFLSLKQRYADSQIETIEERKILWLKGHDGSERDIPLDKDGNIITPWNCDFRRLDLALFREYEEAGRSMRAAMTYANELGAFSQTVPEQSPLILGDFALMLREEMLLSPDSSNRMAWISSRANYFKSLKDFLNGYAEAVLVRGYDEVIADETSLSEEGLAALAAMRDELSRSFKVMREEYDKLSFLHEKLQGELVMSFCIMGPQDNTMYSALLANAIITGSHIKLIYDPYIFLWSMAAAFAVLLIIFLLRPFIQLITGFLLSVIAVFVFAFLFVKYSYWIDPLIAFSSSLAGTLFVFCGKLAVLNHRTRRFRAAYGTAVSSIALQRLICLGKPRPSDAVVCSAAVIAIKDINLLNREDREKPQDAGRLKKIFFTSVKNLVFHYGAVIAGYEGDTVLACFGSPLDKTGNPVFKACDMVKELLANEKISWRFGIDTGECTFFWSPETGYSVYGRPAVRARVLVSKNNRLKTRALITDSVKEEIKADVKKIDSLYDERESIYELSVK